MICLNMPPRTVQCSNQLTWFTRKDKDDDVRYSVTRVVMFTTVIVILLVVITFRAQVPRHSRMTDSESNIQPHTDGSLPSQLTSTNNTADNVLTVHFPSPSSFTAYATASAKQYRIIFAACNKNTAQ